MASPASGLAPMIMQALQARQGQPPQQGGGGMPGQPQGQDPSATDYASQVASVKGADPGGLLRQLKSMKQILAIMAVQNLERLPNVAGQIFKIIPTFDKVIKEVSQAANVAGAVRDPGAGPIKMGAANPPDGAMSGPSTPSPSGGGMPSPF